MKNTFSLACLLATPFVVTAMQSTAEPMVASMGVYVYPACMEGRDYSVKF